MAALWDIVGKASLLVQLLGLDAFKLVTFAMSFLRLREVKKECKKLEDRVRVLRMLLCSPPVGSWTMTTQLRHLVITALRDAQGLLVSYNESTLFQRVRRGRGMVTEFRDMHSRIDYYCGLILIVNAACLLVIQVNPPPTPPADVRAEVDDEDVAPSTGCSTDAEISSSADPSDTQIIDVSQE